MDDFTQALIEEPCVRHGLVYADYLVEVKNNQEASDAVRKLCELGRAETPGLLSLFLTISRFQV